MVKFETSIIDADFDQRVKSLDASIDAAVAFIESAGVDMGVFLDNLNQLTENG